MCLIIIFFFLYTYVVSLLFRQPKQTEKLSELDCNYEKFPQLKSDKKVSKSLEKILLKLKK